MSKKHKKSKRDKVPIKRRRVPIKWKERRVDVPVTVHSSADDEIERQVAEFMADLSRWEHENESAS